MPTQQAPARPAPAGKHDAAAAAQLARALRRVRNLDVAAGFLVLLAGTLLYALATVCAARWLSAAPLAQQLALAGFILLAVAWLAWAVLRPLFRPINPYFAARRLEATLPAARNSVINWLDLRDQPLPPAIRAAVLRRAAHDLSRADLDRAFSARRLAWAGGFVGLLCVGLLAALIGFGPSQFFARLLHGFFPFASGDIPNRTQLTVVRPEGGNATVPVGRAVSILVAVEGRTPDPRGPDALRLLFRHGPAEPYQERLLEPEDNWQWGTALPAAQVRTGFWYKVAGGDAETPEYHVTARATPLVEKVETVFHFPQYLRRRDETGTDFNLKAPRGTDVQLTAHANRKVKAGRLDVEGKQGRKSYAGEVAPGDANALRFRFPIDQDGQYRVWFTTLEGEANTDPPAWSVTAIPDGPPAVELKVPGKDVTLPADGVLELEGSASDDVGVKRMTLRMRVVGGAALKEKPYRDGKTFELEAGGYPLTLDYFDFVELDKLHNAEGKPVFLQPGTVLEYWLEAEDACEAPGPNVGASKQYRATVTEPTRNRAKQEEARKNAAGKKQGRQQQQDAKLERESEQRRDEELRNDPERQREEEEKFRQEQQRLQDAINQNQPGEAKKDEPKGDSKGDDKPDQPKSKDGGQPDQKPDAGQEKQQPDGGGQSGAKGGGMMGSDQDRGNAKEQPKDGQGAGGAKGGGQQQQRGPGDAGAKDAGGDPKAGGGQGDSKGDPGGMAADARGGDGGAKAGEPKGDPQAGTDRADGKGDDKGGMGGARADSKPAPADDMGGASGKPSGDRADGSSTAKGDAKGSGAGGGAGQSEGRDAKAEDVAKLAPQLGSSDPQQAQAAADKLEAIARNAADPQARAAARQAMDQAGVKPRHNDTHTAASKRPPEQTGKPGSTPAGAGKGGPKQDGAAAGGGKSGDGGKGGATAKGGGAGDGPRGKGDQGSARGFAQGGDGNGAKPGGNMAGGNRTGGGPDRGGLPPLPSPPGDPTHRARLTVLQLESFPERVRKQILADAGMSEAEYRKFLEAYKRLAKARGSELAGGPKPKPGNGTLNDLSSGPADPGGRKPGDTRSAGRAVPPPGFGDIFKEFTRRRAEQEGAGEKK